MISKEGLSAVQGFKYSGISTSKEINAKKNMGLIFSEVENTFGTAVYTLSDVLAAPVIISKKMDQLSSNKRVILINSGDANAFTGKQGMLDADKCINTIAEKLNLNKEQCYIGSTGVIGRYLKMDTILSHMDLLIESLDRKNDLDFVHSIMTTDTKPKQASIKFKLKSKEITIAACAKGSGMIMPDMATMLSMIVSDAAMSPEIMKKVLFETVEDTYNCITVDGDTSTNDSVFFLTNGLADNELISFENEDYQIFKKHLFLLLEHMAMEIVRDGEGVTKFITIDVLNAVSREKAKLVTFSIANSPLVKTAFYGENPNWGRLLMAIGKAKTRMNCDIIDITINSIMVVNNGEPVQDKKVIDELGKSLKQTDISIIIDFKQGNSSIRVWTCDYSLEYIKINADYLT